MSDIDSILKLDIKSASALAKEHGVSLTGCRHVNDIRDRLIQHFSQQQKEKDYGGFLNAQNNTKKITEKLLEMIRGCTRLHNESPRKIQHNLQQSYPDLLQQFKDREKALEKGEVWILVAGEVGSGKSSAINLILDCQLLPTDALRCTNTIIEIRSSDKKEARCIFGAQFSDSMERQRRVSPRIINMSSLNGIQEFKDTICECDESDDNPYDRIELYYPFKSLSKNVVIVDTPGVEGGNNIDQRLQKYLTKAFGFIYVINTNTAGGVQQSRLGHLLKTVVNATDDLNPEASLFIANKWEHVPDKDKADVQRDILDKLSRVYPGIKPKQVHYMSVTQSQGMFMKHKQRTSEHKVLLEKIGKLVPSSLRQGMTNTYWWISSFLARASYLLRVTGVQHEMSRDELETKYEQMQRHVIELQRNSDETVKKLRDKVEFEIFRISNMIKEEIISRRFMDYVCNWEDQSDCPPISKRWKNIADEASVRISERIARVLDGWQREHGILQVIDKEIIHVFTNEFGLLEHQVEDIEAFLTNSKGRGKMLHTVRVVPVKKLFAKKKGKVEKTYNTIGGAVSCIGMLDTSKKEVKRLFNGNYSDRTKARIMAEATTLYLKSIIEHKDMSSKLRKFFERFFKDIDEAAKRIPIFLQADQQLIETLSNSMTEIENVREKLPELTSECADMHGNLDIFFINDIMQFDYDLQDLEWEQKEVLGEGSFAKVYKSAIKRKQRPVAIKVSTDAVKIDNVTDILMEDRTMRDLRHPNVVRYYGASFLIDSKGLKWIMVMEICKETLKDYYTDDPDRTRRVPGLIPADHPRRREAVKTTFGHCLDISRGLEYIHEKGYTHRDMKLENVLVAANGSVKITDVGVAKSTKFLVDTCKGSPAYMAPEVLLATKTQTSKIDIYSTAFIFWEMWFGKEVTIDMNREVLGVGFQGDAIGQLKKRMADPRGGWRPDFRSANKPPKQMIDVLQRGWHESPDVRPTATDLAKFFTEMLKNN